MDTYDPDPWDGDLTADEKVAAFALAEYRRGGDNRHLTACPETTIKHVAGSDGVYGCDTGCEYLRFEIDVSCPHGESESGFEYGTFGELDTMLEAIHTGEPSWMLPRS